MEPLFSTCSDETIGAAPTGAKVVMLVIDGVPSRQACLVTVREGMRIERQLNEGGTKVWP